MSTPTLLTRDIATAWRSQRGVAMTLGVGVIALGILFHEEVAAAIRTWMDSTAYNHCFLIIPIAAYLVWDRRATLRGFSAQPVIWPALAGIPIALAWLLAERLGIMEGRQLMAMSFLELLALVVLGWTLWWQVAGPLLYLYFLVPFGDFLTPKLQDITTGFVQHGLNLLQIPNYITGYTIEIPEGTFYIAEACAGLRFLIASIAFGVLYALLMYRSPLRRVAFIAASMVVPIIANGMRAVGIIALGHVLGSAKAAATDHVLYGWIFFSLVILLLIALGLPFREDIAREGAAAATPRRATMPPMDHWRGALIAGIVVVLLAAAGPAVAMQLDSLGKHVAGSIQPLNFGPGCTDLAADVPAPPDTPGHLASQRIVCGGLTLDVHVDVFGKHSTSAPVLAAQRRLTDIPNTTHDDNFETETVTLPVTSGPANLWRLVRTTAPGPMVAVAIWVNGKPAGTGLRMRAHMAWQSLMGAAVAPVVVAVRPVLQQYWLPLPVARTVETRLASVVSQADLTGQIVHVAGGHVAGGLAAGPQQR
ncbi:MAG TPA: exosortase A [Acetobacteraceae bacterium]|nr:exosortase A [Acetobacteraceae bacterium]